MVSIIVASKNPVKVQATLNGFQQLFPDQDVQIRSVSVPSQVADQPYTSHETLQGAQNRAANARAAIPDADFWVGIEGGVEEDGDELAVFAWVVVQSRQFTGKGRTGTFYLPPAITRLVRQGVELGDADDIFFNRSNSKRENGAIGILTGDLIDRTRLYEMAVVFALLPFRNPDLYIEK